MAWQSPMFARITSVKGFFTPYTRGEHFEIALDPHLFHALYKPHIVCTMSPLLIVETTNPIHLKVTHQHRLTNLFVPVEVPFRSAQLSEQLVRAPHTPPSSRLGSWCPWSTPSHQEPQPGLSFFLQLESL